MIIMTIITIIKTVIILLNIIRTIIFIKNSKSCPEVLKIGSWYQLRLCRSYARGWRKGDTQAS